MTKAQFHKKYSQLVRRTNRMLRLYEGAALRSGTIDLPPEVDNYRLPKQVLGAALTECAAQWRLQDKAARMHQAHIYRCTYPDFSRV